MSVGYSEQVADPPNYPKEAKSTKEFSTCLTSQMSGFFFAALCKKETT